jgi:small conductance mechanosensitive channel
MGVDAFADSQVIIKLRIKTLPLKQWTVGRELRRRIKNTFDKMNIQIPAPPVQIHFSEMEKLSNPMAHIAAKKSDEVAR